MLHALRSLSNGVIRLHSPIVVAGSCRIVECTGPAPSAMRAFSSAGVFSRTAAIYVDQQLLSPSPYSRLIRRKFSSTSTFRFSEASTTNLTDELLALDLSHDRCQQLQLPDYEEEQKAAVVAARGVPERHVSRSLVERLIADDSTWLSLHNEWDKLVNNKIGLEDLLPLDLPAIESKLIVPPFSLTGGGATAVGRRVERIKQSLSANVLAPHAITPLMKALHAFPRALHHGHTVPTELASLFTPACVSAMQAFVSFSYFTLLWQEVQAEVTKWADKYRDMRAKDRNGLVIDEIVQPLLQKLLEHHLWGIAGFKCLLGEEFEMPFWFSTHRRRELERILQVVWRFESLGGTSVNRESRVWWGGHQQGKTVLMRITALLCSLLHKRLVVCYNEYSKNQLTPRQLLAMYCPKIQATATPISMVTEMANKGLFPVFFADDVEHCYVKGNEEALQQFLRLADSTRSLCLVTGNVDSLPDMITPRQQTAQWRRLTALNGSKMQSEYFPPVADLMEARSLAQGIRSAGSAPSDDELEAACWRAGGSLGKLVQVLKKEVIVVPPSDGN